MPANVNDEEVKELAERIYDLDAEVYSHLGSSLGRVFNRDRDRCVRELTNLLLTRSQGHVVRSELNLIANMARTIEDKAERKLCMTEYDKILNQVMSLPTSFASGNVIDPELASLNSLNLKDRFSGNNHLVICISWTYGSGGINIAFKLADKLKINYYDKEIFDAVLKRLQVDQKNPKDRFGYKSVSEWEKSQSPAALFTPKHRSFREVLSDFSRFHGLSKRDAVFFNESSLLCDMAKKEDFIILGRCGNMVMTNNHIPHISIYITAPFDQRVRRTIEVNDGLDEKKAKRYLKHLDREKARYIRFYTGRRWADANNYDICVNSASYGIDGTVDFLYRMIKGEQENMSGT